MYTDITQKYKGNTLQGYEIVTDIDAIRNSIRNIFLVYKGEVPGKPGFGNPLRLQLFELFDTFDKQTIQTAIKAEVELYEPRVDVISVDVIMAPEYNRIVIELKYMTKVFDNNYVDTLYLPFSHNDLTYIGTRNMINVNL